MERLLVSRIQTTAYLSFNIGHTSMHQAPTLERLGGENSGNNTQVEIHNNLFYVRLMVAEAGSDSRTSRSSIGSHQKFLRKRFVIG